MNNKKIILSLATAGFLLTGCGGGSSSTKVQDQVINGQVIDPEIQNAQVKVCKNIDATECLGGVFAVTNANGEYTITIPGSEDISNYYVTSKGGVDVETGVDFDGIVLSSPVSLSKEMITPITSLVAEEMNDGSNFEEAQAMIQDKLGLSKDDLSANPKENARVIKKTIILSKIAKQRARKFDDILDNFDKTKGLNDLIEKEVNDENEKAKLKIINEYSKDENSTASEFVDNVVTFDSLVNSDDIQDELKKDGANVNTIYENTKKLGEKVNKALKANNINDANNSQINYLISQLDLSVDLNDDSLVVADIEVPKNVKLNEIQDTAKDVLDHNIPLVTLLDGTSDSKREYYYKSSKSRFNQAEAFIRNINDTSTTDDVYKFVAKGYITENQVERGVAYAENKIFDLFKKGDVLRYAGTQLIESNPTKSNEYYEASYDYYKKAIDNKGYSNVSAGELTSLRKVLVGFNKLGKTTKETEILAYYDTISKGFKSAIPYVSYSVGIREVAKYYMKNGNTAKAVELIDKMVEVGKKAPANTRTSKGIVYEYYLGRSFVLSTAALTYSELNEVQKTKDTIDYIQNLRADDGIEGNNGTSYETSKKTETHLRMFLVNAYMNINEKAKAKELIASMASKSYQNESFYKIATYSMDDNLTEALNIIETQMIDQSTSKGKYRDQVKFLTNNGVNYSSPYMALNLIEKENLSDALTVLDKATELLDTAVVEEKESSDLNRSTYYIRYGYSKLGRLYSLAGNETKSKAAFDKAMDIAQAKDTNEKANITTATYQAEAIEQITDDLIAAKDFETAKTILNVGYNIAKDIEDPKSKLEALKDLTYYSYADLKAFPAIELKDEFMKINDEIFAMVKDEKISVNSTDDKSNKEKADRAINLLSYNYASLGEYDKAIEANEEGIKIAKMLISDSSKAFYQKYAVSSYTYMHELEKAFEAAKGIGSKGEIRKALYNIAFAADKYDDFPLSDVATVDVDKDGKPDFFDYGASQEDIEASGLVLDDDVDNDGILDKDDTKPYVKDN